MSDQEELTLISSDEQEIKVEKKVAETCATIKSLLEDVTDQEPVPIPNLTNNVLKEVMKFAKYHYDNPTVYGLGENDKVKELKDWDQKFVKIDQAQIFELILAANYLDHKLLLEVLCCEVARWIKGKTPEEIRKTFNIKNDFTPEEEEQVRKENEWCEER